MMRVIVDEGPGPKSYRNRALEDDIEQAPVHGLYSKNNLKRQSGNKYNQRNSRHSKESSRIRLSGISSSAKNEDNNKPKPTWGNQLYKSQISTKNPTENSYATSGEGSSSAQEDTAPKTDKRVLVEVGELTLKKLARQISGGRIYSVQEPKHQKVKKPSTYFDLSIFTCICCLSPFGLVAIILSVLSGMAYKDEDPEKARKLRIAALTLCIVGIVSTLIIATILVVTNTYPWKHNT